MRRFAKTFLVLSVVLTFFGLTQFASAGNYPVSNLFLGTRTASPRVGFSPTIVATGAGYNSIKSMHILDRPNRPFHFYGNAVRRRHYRQRQW